MVHEPSKTLGVKGGKIDRTERNILCEENLQCEEPIFEVHLIVDQNVGDVAEFRNSKVEDI